MRDLTTEEKLLLAFGVLIGAIIAGIIAACVTRDSYEEPEPEPWRDYSRMPQVRDETEAERREHELLNETQP